MEDLSPTDPPGDRPVLLLAATGLIIRNLVLGGFASEVLAQRPLVAAVPDPQDADLRRAADRAGITLIPFIFPPPPPFSRLERLKDWQTYIYRFQQAQKGTRSLEIQTRLFEGRRPFRRRIPVAALVGIGRILRATGQANRVRERYLDSANDWPTTRAWRDVFLREGPGVIVSTMLTHSTLRSPSVDLAPVVGAHDLGIPTGTLVQSWDNLSSKTSVLPGWLNRYWAWSEGVRKELLELNPHVPPGRVEIVGSPHFDYHLRDNLGTDRDTYLRGLGLDPAKKTILIGTGTAKWLPSEPKMVELLADVISERVPNSQLLIRLHPKDDTVRWKPLRFRLADLGAKIQKTGPELHMDYGGFVPPDEFYGEQISALRAADVILNTASTLTVDAAILDRPVISIGFDADPDPDFPEGRSLAFNGSTHFGRVVQTGGVRVATSVEDCVAMINMYLEDPSTDRAGRQRIVALVAGVTDGGAGHRLARSAMELAASDELAVSF